MRHLERLWRARYWVAGLAVVALLVVLPAVLMQGGQEKTTLRVLTAGSLIVPFAEVEAQFEQLHPDVDVYIDGHGSIQVIRYVTDLHQDADVLAVADHSLIPMLMYDVHAPGTDQSYADWRVQFATNCLGIAYTPASKYADELNEGNWYEVLSRPDVTLGVPDARFDACGYRAFMACQLAEAYYDDAGILDNLLGDGFTRPVTITEDGGVSTVWVPEVLEPASERIALRGSSVMLLMLVQAGDVDYAFEYQSVAEQHGLEFLRLPDEINLGSAAHADAYGTVKVKLAFQRFVSVEPEFLGQPIVYGMTVPATAPHPDLAAELVAFIMSPEGQQVLLEYSQPPIVPAVVDNPDRAPSQVRALLE